MQLLSQKKYSSQIITSFMERMKFSGTACCLPGTVSGN